MCVRVALLSPLIATWSWHLAYVVAGWRGNELWMDSTAGDTSFTWLPLSVWVAGIVALIAGLIVAAISGSERDRLGLYPAGLLTLIVFALVACDFGAFAFASMSSEGDGFPADPLVITLLVLGVLLTAAPIVWMWWHVERPTELAEAAHGSASGVFMTVVVLQVIFVLIGFVVTGVGRPEDTGAHGMLLLFALYPGVALLASYVGLDLVRRRRLRPPAAWAVLALPVIDVLLVVYR